MSNRGSGAAVKLGTAGWVRLDKGDSDGTEIAVGKGTCVAAVGKETGEIFGLTYIGVGKGTCVAVVGKEIGEIYGLVGKGVIGVSGKVRRSAGIGSAGIGKDAELAVDGPVGIGLGSTEN
jgi:hypothetical protein